MKLVRQSTARFPAALDRNRDRLARWAAESGASNRQTTNETNKWSLGMSLYGLAFGCPLNLSSSTAEAAFYFAGVTYTTIGYGDLVLAKPWRILGPVEGLTGILMCGLSAGPFFRLVSRIYSSQLSPKPNKP